MLHDQIVVQNGTILPHPVISPRLDTKVNIVYKSKKLLSDFSVVLSVLVLLITSFTVIVGILFEVHTRNNIYRVQSLMSTYIYGSLLVLVLLLSVLQPNIPKHKTRLLSYCWASLFLCLGGVAIALCIQFLIDFTKIWHHKAPLVSLSDEGVSGLIPSFVSGEGDKIAFLFPNWSLFSKPNADVKDRIAALAKKIGHMSFTLPPLISTSDVSWVHLGSRLKNLHIPPIVDKLSMAVIFCFLSGMMCTYCRFSSRGVRHVTSIDSIVNNQSPMSCKNMHRTDGSSVLSGKDITMQFDNIFNSKELRPQKKSIVHRFGPHLLSFWSGLGVMLLVCLLFVDHLQTEVTVHQFGNNICYSKDKPIDVLDATTEEPATERLLLDDIDNDIDNDIDITQGKPALDNITEVYKTIEDSKRKATHDDQWAGWSAATCVNSKIQTTSVLDTSQEWLHQIGLTSKKASVLKDKLMMQGDIVVGMGDIQPASISKLLTHPDGELIPSDSKLMESYDYGVTLISPWVISSLHTVWILTMMSRLFPLTAVVMSVKKRHQNHLIGNIILVVSIVICVMGITLSHPGTMDKVVGTLKSELEQANNIPSVAEGTSTSGSLGDPTTYTPGDALDDDVLATTTSEDMLTSLDYIKEAGFSYPKVLRTLYIPQKHEVDDTRIVVDVTLERRLGSSQIGANIVQEIESSAFAQYHSRWITGVYFCVEMLSRSLNQKNPTPDHLKPGDYEGIWKASVWNSIDEDMLVSMCMDPKSSGVWRAMAGSTTLLLYGIPLVICVGTLLGNIYLTKPKPKKNSLKNAQLTSEALHTYPFSPMGSSDRGAHIRYSGSANNTTDTINSNGNNNNNNIAGSINSTNFWSPQHSIQREGPMSSTPINNNNNNINHHLSNNAIVADNPLMPINSSNVQNNSGNRNVNMSGIPIMTHPQPIMYNNNNNNSNNMMQNPVPNPSTIPYTHNGNNTAVVGGGVVGGGVVGGVPQQQHSPIHNNTNNNAMQYPQGQQMMANNLYYPIPDSTKNGTAGPAIEDFSDEERQMQYKMSYMAQDRNGNNPITGNGGPPGSTSHTLVHNNRHAMDSFQPLMRGYAPSLTPRSANKNNYMSSGGGAQQK